jgi:hypothetical protein
MRKALWIMLAVLSVTIAVPIAQADTTAVSVPSVQADPLFTYSYSEPIDGFSLTTAPISAVTMATTVPGADLTATSTSGVSAGCSITSVVLDLGGVGDTFTRFGGCSLSAASVADGFALTDYSTPGTYLSGSDTLVVAAVVTPEPNSVVLLLLGAGLLLFVTRKQIGQLLLC